MVLLEIRIELEDKIDESLVQNPTFLPPKYKRQMGFLSTLRLPVRGLKIKGEIIWAEELMPDIQP